MVDDFTGKLNESGKKQLKTVIENYKSDDINKINEINIELNEAKDMMKNNIKELSKNVENVEDLEQKAVALKEGAKAYNDQAIKLKRATWWQNCKWLIILILVIILLLIIILPISLSSGDDDEKKENEDKNNNNNNNNNS